MISREKNEKERIYLNISMPFDPERKDIFNISSIAEYSQTFSESLLSKDSSNYCMSIVRMTIPTNLVPIKIFPCIPNPDDVKDVNMSSYFIVFKYGITEFKRHLRWDTLDFGTYPSLPDLQNPKNYIYYSMYSMQHFCNIINNCMGELMNDIYGFLPPPPPGLIYPQPYMTFDATTYLFSFIVNDIMTENSTSGTTLQILFDNELFFNFVYFKAKFATYTNNFISYPMQRFSFLNNPTLRYNLQVDDIYGHTYKFSQEGDSTGTLTDFKVIRVSSNTLKINHELQSSATDNYGGQYEPILSDFGNVSSFKDILSFINYTPSAEYRRLTLKQGDKINQLQLNISWVDKRGFQYPLYIERDNILSLKILFEEL